MPFYLFIRIPKFDIQVVLLTLYSTLELNNVLNVSFKSETLSLPITNIRCSLFLTITLENMPLNQNHQSNQFLLAYFLFWILFD